MIGISFVPAPRRCNGCQGHGGCRTCSRGTSAVAMSSDRHWSSGPRSSFPMLRLSRLSCALEVDMLEPSVALVLAPGSTSRIVPPDEQPLSTDSRKDDS